jgi:hypothetical protein
VGLQHPKVFVAVAQLDGVRVVAGLPLADDVHLKAVLVHGDEFLALAHAKGGIHFDRRIE